MNYLDLLNFVNSKVITILYITVFLIIAKLFIKLLFKDEKILKNYDLVLYRTAEALIIATIPLLLFIYFLHYPGAISLFIINAAIVLGMAILVMETKTDKSPLIDEIENMNISNSKKTIIKLFINNLPLILSIIIFIGLILLVRFPTNETLTSIVLNLLSLNLFIVLLDACISSIILLKRVLWPTDWKMSINP